MTQEPDYVNDALNGINDARKKILVAYGDSLNTNQMMSILLRDILVEVGKIQDRLAEIQSLG